jgi:hypothetical protein
MKKMKIKRKQKIPKKYYHLVHKKRKIISVKVYSKILNQIMDFFLQKSLKKS